MYVIMIAIGASRCDYPALNLLTAGAAYIQVFIFY